MRIEPPPSLAVQNGTMPADDRGRWSRRSTRPASLDGSHGLRVTPEGRARGVGPACRTPGAAVLPMGTAPAARSRPTWIESCSTGRPAREQQRAPASSACRRSPRGPSRRTAPRPAARAHPPGPPPAPDRRPRPALARASTSRWTNALSSPLRSSIASRQIPSSSAAETWPRRTRCAASRVLGISMGRRPYQRRRAAPGSGRSARTACRAQRTGTVEWRWSGRGSATSTSSPSCS